MKDRKTGPRVQGQTYTRRPGICCHEPKVPRCSLKGAVGGKRTQCFWGEWRHSSKMSPPAFRFENRVKRTENYAAGPRSKAKTGVGTAAEGPQATILLIAPSEPTMKGKDWRGGTHKRDVGPHRIGSRCKR